VGCAAASPNNVEITSLVQGLMREDGGAWRVYERGDTFAYKPNGTCTTAGTKQEHCMWFGFEFDYKATAETTTLTCAAKLSLPIDLVTNKTEEAKNTQEANFELTFTGRSGHVANPGYLVIGPGESPEQHTRVECSHAGKVVLRYAFNIHGV
jgi:hypothetical protein